MKWNKMQEKAIYTQNKNILVSASAGSGKTAVLIARLLNLIQKERIEINEILAMTFSEAAANEMKKRMAKQLNEALSKCNDEDETKYLQKQLANLSNAHISTIHGFCLDIIQNYYYTINLNKERVNTIMDDALTSKIIQNSMNETLANFMNQERFLTLSTLFSARSNSNNNLKENILSLFYLATSKSDPYAFLNTCRGDKPILTLGDYPVEIKSYFFDYLSVQADSIKNACAKVESILLSLTEMDKIEKITAKLAALALAQNAIIDEDYNTFQKNFLASCLLITPSVSKNEEITILRKEIDTIEGTLLSLLFEEKDFIHFTNTNIEIINTFIDVCIYFLTTYERLKEEEKCIDFGDMEYFALKILKSNDKLVASIYRDKFKEIMVDEFQDSNDVQDELVRLICRDNNVFRVGDIKQSIYGFRHATPEIMMKLIQDKKENDEVIYLNNNYRSKESIVDFNNVLFSVLMNVEGFSSSFSEFDETQIGLEEQCIDNQPIHFVSLNMDSINATKEIPFSKDELKADYIAHKIIELKQQGYHYNDFVVLIKTNAKSDPLRKSFEDYNIPYFINMKHGFYDSFAVRNIISFLQALSNPHDNIAMCACLLSTFFMKSDSYLVSVKTKKQEHESYYTYLNAHSSDLNIFNELLVKSEHLKLSEILKEIYQINEYYQDYTTTQEKANLDKLYEIACTHETKQFMNIELFLEMLEQSKDAQIGEAISIGSNDDVVKVMSIHQSKGLQFPVVFLYSTSSISIQDTQGIAGFDDILGVSFNYMELENRFTYPTLERIAMNHKITKSALEEEMRVLYVATTRAQNEMYIVDCLPKYKLYPIDKTEIYMKRGFTSWLMQSFLKKNDFASHFIQAILMKKSIQSLYVEEVISEDWNTPMQEDEDSKQTTINKYSFISKEIKMSSPSDNELLSYAPTLFSYQENYAAQRGTTLHKMVELLPATYWDKDLINKVCSIHQLSIDEHDIEILLALNENDIFINSKTHASIYHEFPFMVKLDNTLIHGYMDYVSIQDNQITMIDFKSDKKVDIEILKQRYSEQINAYTKALHILYEDKKIQSYIYSFELKCMISI